MLMRRNLTAHRSLVAVAFVLLLLAAPAWGQGQIRILPPAESVTSGQVAVTASHVQSVLQRATELESQERWSDALAMYEEALRDYPKDGELSKRHDLAKVHCDLARRYNDASFVKSLTTVNERQAASLYSEVLVKIESHYVSPPNWQSLVRRGAMDLEVSLDDRAFQQRNLRGRSAAEREQFKEQLRGLVRSRAVNTKQQAVDVVNAAISLGRPLQMPAASIAFEFACGAIGALDTYSAYLTSDQLTEVYSQIEGNFVGLGVELKAGAEGLNIVKVITGSPAARAGIKGGDRITWVDGKQTTELSTDQAADLLQGPEGSVADVVVLSPNGQSRRLSVRREHVEVPSVDDVQMIDVAAGIGYLKLWCFQKTTSRDLDNALFKLQREGMKSLIIDLRGNPGGLLTASVEVADKFLEDGTIVSTRGRSPLEDFNYTAKKPNTWRIPLVVLIDGDSASASEIFAGAIRDHHRGKLVGTRSYGKGSVQGIFPLALANSGVRLTTAKFYSPSGQPISHVGVEPDIQVREVAKLADGRPAQPNDDAALEAAKGAARDLLARSK